MNRHYNIAFVGLGSIGKRHLSNVISYMNEQGDSFSIDLYRHALSDSIPDGVSGQYLYLDDINEDKCYDAIFVTNPTSMHIDAVKKFLKHTKSFFIEKPVFDSVDVDAGFINDLQKKIAYVACPLRYNAVLQYVKQSEIYKDAISVRAISSSYLPDWRPGQDYRQCYSAHKDMGGGVGIDLIHEWDYLTWLFGMPIECKSIQSKLSDLEIDSEDLAIYVARTNKTAIEVHLDYFGKQTLRKLQLFLPNETVECDLVNGDIKYLKSGMVKHFDTERNIYQMLEIAHFFDILNNKIKNDSTVAHAIEVLKISKGEQI